MYSLFLFTEILFTTVGSNLNSLYIKTLLSQSSNIGSIFVLNITESDVIGVETKLNNINYSNMEKNQPAKVTKGPIKLSDKQLEELKKNLKVLKKNQLPQKSNDIKEEDKNTKEFKTKENIKGGSKNEFKTSAEYSDQISNIKSIFKNCSLIKELTDKYGEEKVHQIAEQIEGIDLVKFLKAKGSSFYPKKNC